LVCLGDWFFRVDYIESNLAEMRLLFPEPEYSFEIEYVDNLNDRGCYSCDTSSWTVVCDGWARWGVGAGVKVYTYR